MRCPNLGMRNFDNLSHTIANIRSASAQASTRYEKINCVLLFENLRIGIKSSVELREMSKCYCVNEDEYPVGEDS